MDYVTIFEIQKNIFPSGTIGCAVALVIVIMLFIREIIISVVRGPFSKNDIIPILFLFILCVVIGTITYNMHLAGGSGLGMHVKQYYEEGEYLEIEGKTEKYFCTEGMAQFYVNGVKFQYRRADVGEHFWDDNDKIKGDGQNVRIRYFIDEADGSGIILKIDISEKEA